MDILVQALLILAGTSWLEAIKLSPPRAGKDPLSSFAPVTWPSRPSGEVVQAFIDTYTHHKVPAETADRSDETGRGSGVSSTKTTTTPTTTAAVREETSSASAGSSAVSVSADTTTTRSDSASTTANQVTSSGSDVNTTATDRSSAIVVSTSSSPLCLRQGLECAKNASCLPPRDGGGRPECRCNAGFVGNGSHCEENVDVVIRAEASRASLASCSKQCHNGVCEKNGTNATCLCNRGWAGERCSQCSYEPGFVCPIPESPLHPVNMAFVFGDVAITVIFCLILFFPGALSHTVRRFSVLEGEDDPSTPSARAKQHSGLHNLLASLGGEDKAPVRTQVNYNYAFTKERKRSSANSITSVGSSRRGSDSSSESSTGKRENITRRRRSTIHDIISLLEHDGDETEGLKNSGSWPVGVVQAASSPPPVTPSFSPVRPTSFASSSSSSSSSPSRRLEVLEDGCELGSSKSNPISPPPPTSVSPMKKTKKSRSFCLPGVTPAGHRLQHMASGPKSQATPGLGSSGSQRTTLRPLDFPDSHGYSYGFRKARTLSNGSLYRGFSNTRGGREEKNFFQSRADAAAKTSGKPSQESSDSEDSPTSTPPPPAALSDIGRMLLAGSSDSSSSPSYSSSDAVSSTIQTTLTHHHLAPDDALTLTLAFDKSNDTMYWPHAIR